MWDQLPWWRPVLSDCSCFFSNASCGFQSLTLSLFQLTDSNIDLHSIRSAFCSTDINRIRNTQPAYQLPASNEFNRLLSISMSFTASLSISADMYRHCAVVCSSLVSSLALCSVRSTSSRDLATACTD